jgi:hypothetical protein
MHSRGLPEAAAAATRFALPLEVGAAGIVAVRRIESSQTGVTTGQCITGAALQPRSG